MEKDSRSATLMRLSQPLAQESNPTMNVGEGRSDISVFRVQKNMSSYSVRAVKLHERHFISAKKQKYHKGKRLEWRFTGHGVPNALVRSVVKAKRQSIFTVYLQGRAVFCGTIWLLGFCFCITVEQHRCVTRRVRAVTLGWTCGTQSGRFTTKVLFLAY